MTTGYGRITTSAGDYASTDVSGSSTLSDQYSSIVSDVAYYSSMLETALPSSLLSLISADPEAAISEISSELHASTGLPSWFTHLPTPLQSEILFGVDGYASITSLISETFAATATGFTSEPTEISSSETKSLDYGSGVIASSDAQTLTASSDVSSSADSSGNSSATSNRNGDSSNIRTSSPSPSTSSTDNTGTQSSSAMSLGSIGTFVAGFAIAVGIGGVLVI
ncbi:hypothetical protein K470DRAFT_263427 [Piedraia hortae CBS 480.64]|uniref:Uncharacterized protein n=1 Tax=Piedraia hortae CBS 480.64 TaxID=1314780 RepID=A0A6A7C2P6_9PEZI|nr:hypothetical protein K470DRAFT_263427 [Piedraia hortae CBS 480.64]